MPVAIKPGSTNEEHRLDEALDTADLHWMERALDEAARAIDCGEVPIGAVLVQDGRLLAAAHNRPIGLHDPTAHAEILALRAAATAAGAYRLPGTTLYATIEPCAMCLGAALHARVARVVFGAGDPKGGACGSVVDLSAIEGLNHQIEVRRGVQAERAAALLRGFFEARRTRAGAFKIRPLGEVAG